MSSAAQIPVLVGVGEFSERLDAAGYRGLSPVELAVEAAQNACKDALSVEKVARHFDTIAAVPPVENTPPAAPAPLVRPNNFPRSPARRLGTDPRRAILEV